MEFEWDERKSAANLRKHGVAFSDAITVLSSDDRAITLFEETAGNEERYVTIGTDALGRILVVVYAVRGRYVRIISARRANKRERKEYEQ
jgi:uncharacterized DUF497 family protein